ncbi:MAG: ATP-binding protein [Treponema sp.]|nr:ATP-binding protein [Spirochaetales bacterium]MDY5812682.1 ATP-binding protein [Treponema sp.]
MKTKSLTFKIFINTFFTGTIIYFICAFIFISHMYGYFENQLFTELESESNFLNDYALNGELDRLSSLQTKNRITLIHGDGTVYFDNTVDIATLGNHSIRQEFIDAKSKGTVKLSRFSSTMTEKTLYFARSLSNGDVLRISCNQHAVWVLVLGMSQILLIMFVIALIISDVSASCISRRITEPLNMINLETPEESEVYDELKPFTKRIAEENFEKDQREELRQQFTANVSHELKTPLTSISGFAEILKAGGVDEETTKDFASSIYEESQRMITLVNDIIRLSKLDEKSISLEKEPISLRSMCLDVIKAVSPSAKNKNVSLNLSGDSGLINGVQPVIYEMVYNLIDNAVKYNVENGSVNIKIQNMMDAQKVILTVQDTGIGIPANEKDRIFERFYRVDKSRSKQNGGTGLGLSIVKHAAKYHNASILVNSELGKGSTFTVILPV